jgi:hypothetical protein
MGSSTMLIEELLKTMDISIPITVPILELTILLREFLLLVGTVFVYPATMLIHICWLFWTSITCLVEFQVPGLRCKSATLVLYLSNKHSWSFGPDWPNNGEIDIIEGVNEQNVNYMTIHVGAQCSVTAAGTGLLQPFSTDCDASDNGNAGCSFHDTDTNSYGTGFNNNGGGIFAMEWTSSGVSIWRWYHGSAPGDVLADNPDPSNWGPPSANWGSDSTCDWASIMNQHNLVFDTTFCGSWAGAVYDGPGSSCTDYVANNPGAFQGAYWGVNALKVYQQSGNAPNIAASSASVSEPTSTTSLSEPTSTTLLSEPASTSSVPETSTTEPSSATSAVATSVQTSESSATSVAPQSYHHHHHSYSASTVLPTTAFLTSVIPTSVPPSTPAPSATSSAVADKPAASPTDSQPAEETSQPLTGDDFGQGSQGIPISQEGWKRAADMKMGERRAQRHRRARTHRRHPIEAAA